ncbi:unnamed protein product [Lampetra planeri]
MAGAGTGGNGAHRNTTRNRKPEELTRVFVALFDYDPLSMSPNPDAADEELPFKEGQIIKVVFGNKDTDGFYRAEIRDRVGLIPCNMVSEIQTEDDDMMGQLLKQGFLPLNTPVEKLGETLGLQQHLDTLSVYLSNCGLDTISFFSL